MGDYLDEMLEAANTEGKLWRLEGNHVYYEAFRDGKSVSQSFSREVLFRLSDRAKMKAAYEAAKSHFHMRYLRAETACVTNRAEAVWESLFGVAHMPQSHELNADEIAGHTHYIGNYVYNDPASCTPTSEESRKIIEKYSAQALGLQNLVSAEDWNKIFGFPKAEDGVALTSVAHPPCEMFPEESERDRIARITREMCGG